MTAVPFKLNQDRRHHIPRQQHKVTNWRAYEAGLRQRGSLTVWFSDDARWSALVFAAGDPDSVDAAHRIPPRLPAD